MKIKATLSTLLITLLMGCSGSDGAAGTGLVSFAPTGGEGITTFNITPNGMKVSLVRKGDVVERIVLENTSDQTRYVDIAYSESLFGDIYPNIGSTNCDIYEEFSADDDDIRAEMNAGDSCEFIIGRNQSGEPGDALLVDLATYNEQYDLSSETADRDCSFNLFITYSKLNYVAPANGDQDIPEDQEPQSSEDANLWRTFDSDCQALNSSLR